MTHPAVGLAACVLLAWPVALGLLRWGQAAHSYNTARPWTTPTGVPCGVRISRLAFSDWFQVRPIRPQDSSLPLGDAARVPAWVAAPAAADPWLALVDTGAHGWPLRAFAAESWQYSKAVQGSTPPSFERLRWGCTIAATPRGRIILPLRPIWSGLAADTAVFAACSWMLAAVLGGARAALRRSRGCCARCGYDLRGLAGAPCPECGQAA